MVEADRPQMATQWRLRKCDLHVCILALATGYGLDGPGI